MIAILATIAIVSYNGIQERARNTQVITLVNQWEKTLALYKVMGDGEYPTGNLEYVCLGTNFPAAAPYAENQCMVTSSWSVSVDNNLMQEIEDVADVQMPIYRLPSVSITEEGGAVQHYRGLLYLSRNGGVGITYILKGNGQACTNGDGFFELDNHVACRRVLQGDPYQGL